MKNNRLLFVTVTFLVLSLGACRKSATSNEAPLFAKTDAQQTGVTFENKLSPTDTLNIVDYLYFYNGGGIAAGDVNNDGLTDLYFVSNQGENKLYLNKGQMKFEDITAKSGTGGKAQWQTGVTMADVNADGWLDIYVCAVGNYSGLTGANELYINNQDGTFTEKSAEYGLHFVGFSTQAGFFDYDHDGDLDCYLLNHAVHTSRSYDRVSTRLLSDNSAGDHLYRNDGGRFTDVSQASGIYQAAMGYGLGLAISDLNNDGWEDIYVSNDFHEDDYYYINQKNGTFKEAIKEHFAHLSRFSMGSDAADINNDGLPDVMTLDMYPDDEAIEKSSVGEDPFDIYLYKLQFGYFNQYSRNCLHLNHNGEKFVEVAMMAGIAATDWSWSPLLADFDHDGIKDLFISNGIPKRPNDLEYIKYVSGNPDSLRYAANVSTVLESKAFEKMPDGAWHNYYFKGTPSLKFEDKSEAYGFSEANCTNGSIYADLDNDGDLDLVANNLNAQASIFKNESNQQNNYLKIKLQGQNGNTFGLGAKVYLKQGGNTQLLEQMPTRGFLSSVEPILNFGLGKATQADTLTVVWNTGKTETIHNVKGNQTLTLSEKNAKDARPLAKTPTPLFTDITKSLAIPYLHQENVHYDFNRQPLIPFRVSTEGPALAVGDVNGDGLEDFYAGGSRFQKGELYLQKATGTGFAASVQAAFEADSVFEDVDAVFFDADGDRDLDLYVVSGGNEYYGDFVEQFDRLYLNDGKGNFKKNEKALPPMFENKACVRPCDFDKDGDTDLFVGGRVKGYGYGQKPTSYLLVNNGKGVFADKTEDLAPEIRTLGMITDATWADTDKDGYQDLLVCGDWMPIVHFSNKKGKLNDPVEIENPRGEIGKGFWHSIATGDFDKDGDTDFVVGNLGTNSKFRKAGDESLLKMYVGDFDGNNSVEQVLACNRKGNDNFYPINTRDELGKQMPGIINKRFTNYPSFAGKSIFEVFSGGELNKSETQEVNTFESVFVENLGGQKFKTKALPMAAQVSKIFATHVADCNKDGNLDIMIGGNFYGVSTYQGRYDGFFGLVLLGNGKGDFRSSHGTENGLLLQGEVRSIKPLKSAQGTNYYVVARNNEALQVFR